MFVTDANVTGFDPTSTSPLNRIKSEAHMSDVIDLTGSPVPEANTAHSSSKASPAPRDSNPALQEQLVDAVANIPAERLREYITQAIVENRLIAEGLEDFLLSRRGASGVRVQRVARCGKCRGEFDPAVEREEGECRYHDGVCNINIHTKHVRLTGLLI